MEPISASVAPCPAAFINGAAGHLIIESENNFSRYPARYAKTLTGTKKSRPASPHPNTRVAHLHDPALHQNARRIPLALGAAFEDFGNAGAVRRSLASLGADTGFSHFKAAVGFKLQFGLGT